MVKPVNIHGLNQATSQTTSAAKSQQTGSTSFSEYLEQESKGLSFSKHAQNRLENRQINLSDEGIARLEEAVDKAEKRGSQDSLILMDDMAFIVNVRSRMVVTALDANKRGEGVFTNIDSVVLANTAANKNENAAEE